MRSLHQYIFLLLSYTILFGCTEEIGMEENSQPFHYYQPALSNSLQVSDFPQPERNPATEEGIILGKKLFFDPKLSSNGKVSCASCHQPELAFTDQMALGTHGVTGNQLHRNAPALFNLAWQTEGVFWDGGAKDLESLNFGPLTHPDEMGASLDDIVNYLITDNTYPVLFEAAFPEQSIQSAIISRAISQYVRSLISQTSSYDQWKNEASELNELELKGYQLYQKNCSSCHTEGLFTDGSFHNNGLDKSYPDPPELEGLYQGRFRISSLPEDMGAYRTPSLRNLSFTSPYMHDGRFETLEEVLDHYENGIQTNESLAPQLKNRIKFTPEERTALLNFLKTLDDVKFTQTHSLN